MTLEIFFFFDSGVSRQPCVAPTAKVSQVNALDRLTDGRRRSGSFGSNTHFSQLRVFPPNGSYSFDSYLLLLMMLLFFRSNCIFSVSIRPMQPKCFDISVRSEQRSLSDDFIPGKTKQMTTTMMMTTTTTTMTTTADVHVRNMEPLLEIVASLLCGCLINHQSKKYTCWDS